VQDWLDRIAGAAGEEQLFSYELKYVKAKELADRLAEVFGGSARRAEGQSTGNPSLMPGLEPTQIKDTGVDDNGTSNATIGNGGDSGGSSGLGGGSLSLDQSTSGNGA
jgi:general secretion pathway protein D